ncbi:MAG: PIN domain-containing protein [Chitinophagales bacterium]|nr:PIN domain-containing protein [Chitinophagales bacterium]
MLLISDTNIIVSALINPAGTVSKIIFSKKKFKIIAPIFLKKEIENNKQKFLNYTNYTGQELNSVLKELYAQIEFIDNKEVPKLYVEKAYHLVKDIDLDDVEFVELALYKKCPIWTTDRVLANGLRKKGFTKIITTSELKKYLYLK